MSQEKIRLGIVLYRNAPAELERLARSIESNRRSGIDFAISWLDNSPTDELRAVLQQLGQVGNYRYADRNLGFGTAHNVLMSEAFVRPGCEAYVCVNPDAILHPDCIAELLVKMRGLPRLGLLEALQFPDEHPKIYEKESHQTAWCSGCVLLVTRPLYEAIGGFDERFFMYCEDVDFSWRARAAGFSLAVAPRAIVHHYVGNRPPGSTMVRNMFRSGTQLGAKYGDEAFAKRCLEQYVEIGGAPFPLPPIAPLQQSFAGIADFSHLFHFAKARW
jgi:GT2 family glycosyltransferase